MKKLGSLLLVFTMLVSTTLSASAVEKTPLEEMTEYYAQSFENTSTTDIDIFWNVLAQASLQAPISIKVDYDSLDIENMNAQRLAKVLITQEVTGELDEELFDLMISYQQPEGDFNNIFIVNSSGNPVSTVATEQVFPMLALEIADVEYNKESALSFLYSQQNEDGGWGYGSWSDAGTTSWVLSLLDLMGESGDSYDKGVDYLQSNWSTYVSQKDSNSMGNCISALNDFDAVSLAEMHNQLISASYYSGVGFSWGDSTDFNDLATAQCSQALGDLAYGSVYQRLDDKVTLDSKVENPPVKEEPEKDPPVVIDPVPVEPDTIEVDVRVTIPGRSMSVTLDVEEDTTAFEAFDEACDYMNLSYKGSSSYVEALVYRGNSYGYGYVDTGKDGVLYKVNSRQPSVGMGSYTLDDNDSLHVFYTYDYTEDGPYYGETNVNKPKVDVDSFDIPDFEDIDWEDEELPFYDTKGHWAEEFIRWCYAYDLMGGYGNNQFGPDDPITRAQLATIIYRMFNK